jgi:tRNA dimethylallyltransferase
MAETSDQRIVVIVGPTAGGKSELAVGLAQHFEGEVLGADSMQVYRHLDAGTAKPTSAERAAVPHHLIDIVEPTEPFTVADWLERAESLIAQIHTRGKLPIIVGGTNLYLKALLEGMFPGPPADPDFRASLAEFTPQQMHERLAVVDPQAAERIHPNDRKRIERALEVHHLTGQPISALQRQWEGGVFTDASGGMGYRHDPILLGLRWSTEAINRRINARVKQMFQPSDGSEDLVSETRRLRDAGLLGPQAREALGTRQVLEYLEGRCSVEDAFEQTKIETRRFAKAQRTWLKRYRGVHWIDAEQIETNTGVERAVEIVRSEGV